MMNKIGRPKKEPVSFEELNFICSFRKNRGLTQQSVCDVINKHRNTNQPMTPNSYRRFEKPLSKGGRRMSPEIKDILSKEFNIERKYFDGIGCEKSVLIKIDNDEFISMSIKDLLKKEYPHENIGCVLEVKILYAG